MCISGNSSVSSTEKNTTTELKKNKTNWTLKPPLKRLQTGSKHFLRLSYTFSVISLVLIDRFWWNSFCFKARHGSATRRKPKTRIRSNILCNTEKVSPGDYKNINLSILPPGCHGNNPKWPPHCHLSKRYSSLNNWNRVSPISQKYWVITVLQSYTPFLSISPHFPLAIFFCRYPQNLTKNWQTFNLQCQ